MTCSLYIVVNLQVAVNNIKCSVLLLECNYWFHIISYHIISYHIISYHIISYHIIYISSYIIFALLSGNKIFCAAVNNINVFRSLRNMLRIFV